MAKSSLIQELPTIFSIGHDLPSLEVSLAQTNQIIQENRDISPDLQLTLSNDGQTFINYYENGATLEIVPSGAEFGEYEFKMTLTDGKRLHEISLCVNVSGDYSGLEPDLNDDDQERDSQKHNWDFDEKN